MSWAKKIRAAIGIQSTTSGCIVVSRVVVGQQILKTGGSGCDCCVDLWFARLTSKHMNEAIKDYDGRHDDIDSEAPLTGREPIQAQSDSRGSSE